MPAVPAPPSALRAAFPVSSRWIYFNHAAVAPLSLPVAKAIAAFTRDATLDGSTPWRAWLERRERARAKAARLIGARPDEVAFTTSTSQGLITVAEGLSLDPGDEIIVLEDDFPANHIPWFRQERRGARVVVVPRRDGRVTTADVLERLGDRTRVVAVPTAFYDTGFRLDVEELGRALADHRALLCVDAIQTLGAFPLDVDRARIDFLAADSHKWMLGLEGAGLFYCRGSRLEELDGPLVSWLSVEEPFTSFEPGRPLLGDARRFEHATLPTVAIFGIDACLEMLLEHDVPRFGPWILALTEQLAEGLVARGWTLGSPRAHEHERSGVLAARHPELASDAVVDGLQARGVSVATRGEWVRFAPHAWNTEDEVDRLLSLLPPSRHGP